MSRWNDRMFELTDEEHYFVLEAEILIPPTDDYMYEEYSGMHHATKESAEIELSYVRGDDWGSRVNDVRITEVGE